MPQMPESHVLQNFKKPFDTFPSLIPIDDAMPYVLPTFYLCCHSTQCWIRICREGYTINMYDMSNYGKVIQLLLLEGIYILHIITLKLALIFSDKVIGLYLLQFFVGLQKSSMPYSKRRGRGHGQQLLCI